MAVVIKCEQKRVNSGLLLPLIFGSLYFIFCYIVYSILKYQMLFLNFQDIFLKMYIPEVATFFLT